MIGDFNPVVNSENIMLLYNDTVMQCLSRRQRALLLEWLEVPEGTWGVWPLVSHVPTPRLHNNLMELLEDKNFGFLTVAQRGFLETLNLALENQEPPLYAQAVKRMMVSPLEIPLSAMRTPRVLLDEEEFPPLGETSFRNLAAKSLAEKNFHPVSASCSLPSHQLETKRLIDCLDDVAGFLAAGEGYQSETEKPYSKSQHGTDFKSVKKTLKRRKPSAFAMPVSNSFAGLHVYEPHNQHEQEVPTQRDCSSSKLQRLSKSKADSEASQYMPPTPFRLADALIDEHPTLPMGSRRLTQSQPEPLMNQREISKRLSTHRSDSAKANRGNNTLQSSGSKDMAASQMTDMNTANSLRSAAPEVITIEDSPEIITVEDSQPLFGMQQSALSAFVCPYWWCERLFSQQQSLKDHVFKSHREGSLKHCPYCDFTNSSVYFMRQHMIDNHADYVPSLSLDPRIQNYDGSATSSPIPGYSPRYRKVMQHSLSQPVLKTQCRPLMRRFAAAATLKDTDAHDLWVSCDPDEDVLANVIQYEQEYERDLWQGAVSDSQLLDIVKQFETQSKPVPVDHPLDISLSEFFFPATQSSSSISPVASGLYHNVLVPDSQEEPQIVPESPCFPEYIARQASSNNAQLDFQSGGYLAQSQAQQVDAEMTEEEDMTDAEIPRKRLHLLEGQPVLFQEGNFIVKLVESGLDGAARTYCIIPNGVTYNKDVIFMQEATPAVLRTIRLGLEQHDAVKVQITMAATFVKADDENKKCSAGFHTDTIAVFQANGDLAERLDGLFLQLAIDIDEFQNRGSDWVLHQVDFMDIRIASYLPLRGSSYIKLPQSLANKKACINVINKKDNECFKWAVLSRLHPVKYNANRVSSYLTFKDELNFNGIAFPVMLDDIKKFESQNSRISITVFGWKNGKSQRAPLYVTQNPQADTSVNLLLLKEDNKMHYCWIKRLSAFFSNGKDKTHFCRKCFLMFRNEKWLTKHECKCRKDTIELMPTEDVLEFKNYHRIWPVGCVIYADLEALQPKVEGWDNTQNSQRANVSMQTKHEPSGYCLITALRCCNNDPQFQPHEWYRGENAIDRFLQRVLEIGEDHQKRIDNAKRPLLTPDQWQEHRRAKECYLCHKPFSILKKDQMGKVLDHCHLCGKYRGTAHASCNIKLYESRNVHVWFHNLRRYDGHFIFQHLGPIAVQKGLKIDCIPKGIFDYITFSLKKKHTITVRKNQNKKVTWNLSFRDTFAFMPCSLAKMVVNLKAAGLEKFRAMRMQFKLDAEFQLMLRKGLMPYEYIDSWGRFKETQLPPRKEWYNRLNLEGISEDEYNHALEVWRCFDCNDLGDYHDLYMITDVLLLADIFENFRSTSRSAYDLDPAHYVTLPSYSWDALLKNVATNGTVLELLTDPEMYAFVEKGIRGGVSMVSHRYARANNPMVSNYNEDEPRTWLMYLDANNLYGWAMNQLLPRVGFAWDNNPKDWSADRILQLDPNAPEGYFFEVTLNVFNDVHDWHNMYPLAPESMLITEDDLSPYAHYLIEKHKFHTGSRKLVPHLRRKKLYVLHYRNLQFYLKHGLIVEEVHRVLKFEQSAWMKPYIDFNTEKRKAATNDFEKDNFKLMNNACFGKSMEDVRKRRDIRFATKKAQFEKLVSKQAYVSFHVVSEDLVVVELKKTEITLNKPIYTGLSVLDLSKLLMYEFHYDVMIKKYGYDKLKLILTDTDSLLYEIETHNVYDDFAEPNMAQHFDFSDYPKDHPLQNNSNKKVLGKMKDELNGIPIHSVIALKPKMYSIMPAKGEEKKRAKGVKRALVVKQLRHNDYLETLLGEGVRFHEGHFLRPVKHQMYLMKENKRGLCCFDDKRFLLMDGITSRPYGHYLNGPEASYSADQQSVVLTGSDSLFDSGTQLEEHSLSPQLHAASLYEDSDSSDEKSYRTPAYTYSRQELSLSQQNRRAAVEALTVSQFLNFIYQ